MIFVQTNIICAVIYVDYIKINFVLNKFIPWRNIISGSIYIVRSLSITLLNEPDAHSYVHLKTTSTWSEAHYDPSTETGSLLTDPSCLVKYSSTPLELYPSTTSLNYGTTVWEGLKCYRQSDGVARVLRPDMNYARFCRGAAAMCLPPFSYALFMRSIQRALVANGDLVQRRPRPPGGGRHEALRPSDAPGQRAAAGSVFVAAVFPLVLRQSHRQLLQGGDRRTEAPPRDAPLPPRHGGERGTSNAAATMP